LLGIPIENLKRLKQRKEAVKEGYLKPAISKIPTYA